MGEGATEKGERGVLKCERWRVRGEMVKGEA
jgi:hypothetical protein